MRLLVTGGLGYVGAVAARHLAEAGHEVRILDDLSTGRRESAGGLPVTVADCRDVPTLSGLLEHGRVEAVLHFAGLSQVGASSEDPAGHYAANLGGLLGILEAMRRAGVPRLVFSSSAAVYGAPGRQPIPEDAPLAPLSPYGRSKAMAEGILRDAAEAGQVRAACLRYFNAAGAVLGGTLGEDHRPETHLVPRVLGAASSGAAFTVYGGDYPTPDGTAIRDYVHVGDLARAHAAALGALSGRPFLAINLGTGRGHSVLEVLRCAERVTGKKIRMEMGARRKGDPAMLVADPGASRELLGFKTEESGLDQIVESAHTWHASRRS